MLLGISVDFAVKPGIDQKNGRAFFNEPARVAATFVLRSECAVSDPLVIGDAPTVL